MVDKKITELNNLTGADLVDADEFVVVDISADETKAITAGQLKTVFLPIAGGTMTGFLQTTSDIKLHDGDRVLFGDGNDLQMYHNGSNSFIKNITGEMFIRQQTVDGRVFFQAGDGAGGTDNYIILDGGTGEVELRYGNATKLATKAAGVEVTGDMVVVSVGKPANVLDRTGSNGAISEFKNDGVTVGTISVTDSATAYNTSSDYRLKENIVPIQGAADIVKAMKPCTYTFKADGSWSDGFLAHEMQELHPQAVTGSKDSMMDEEYEVTPAVISRSGEVVEEAVMATRSVPDYQGVDYSKLTPILTAALQEALNKIEDLQARMAVLEAT